MPDEPEWLVECFDITNVSGTHSKIIVFGDIQEEVKHQISKRTYLPINSFLLIGMSMKQTLNHLERTERKGLITDFLHFYAVIVHYIWILVKKKFYIFRQRSQGLRN